MDWCRSFLFVFDPVTKDLQTIEVKGYGAHLILFILVFLFLLMLLLFNGLVVLPVEDLASSQ